MRLRMVAVLSALALMASACSTGDAASDDPSEASESSSPSASPSLGADKAPMDPTESITIPEGLESAKDRGQVIGADMSWPQCPRGMGIPKKRTLGAPLPVEKVEYVILGLTNGPAFYPNPCLEDQVAWVRDREKMAAAYAVLSYPEKRHLDKYRDDGPFDGTSKEGALSNLGYAQAKFNVTTMEEAGLKSPVVWMDVEPVPDFEWSNDTAANAAVVEGAHRGFQDAGYEVGVYSTQYMWREVVGDLRLGLPEWRAAGETSRQEALKRCQADSMFQGGVGVLGQWVERNRDFNLTCPGTSAHMDVWFHQY